MSRCGAEDDGARIEAGETNSISPAIAENSAENQVTVEDKYDAPKDSPNEVAVDLNIVDWDSPNDPANPRNWSRKSKMLNISLISLSVLYSNIATTMYAPGASELVSELKITSNIVMVLSVTITSLGASLGPLAFAPLSEVVGRVPIYWASGWLFIGCTIGCARSSNAAMFLVFRFLSGACTASFMTCGGGTIADLLPKEERGAAMALFTAGPLLGPVVGPVAGIITTMAMLTMRETNATIILVKKAARLRKETGNSELRPAHSSPQTSPSARQFAERALLRPLRVLLFSPIVLLTGVYMAFIFGLTYLLFATFPVVFEETYHWEVGVTGLAYLGLGIGCVLGLITFSLLSDKLSGGRDGTPERRLILMILIGPFIPVGIFWYGWAADRAAQWIVPIIGTSFIGMGTLVVSSSAQLYIVDMFGPQGAASALAALTLIRNASGAFLPLAAVPLYDRLGLGWGNSVLGFITLAFTPVPFVFFKYGGWLRAKFPLEFQRA
ncbi:hypothetical protein TCE0_013r00827 [Talaromyces pinophilus]|uniref:Major facilitator superfamily (MFS) profile domain-containing protein n=1 Tax=Talaromyces pinophilus TaxID=128442 RepID=A0A698XLA4_TALPI|nr:hypothetical protein TCE0_013r00827 [Talaromyces pinophilus]